MTHAPPPDVTEPPPSAKRDTLPPAPGETCTRRTPRACAPWGHVPANDGRCLYCGVTS